MPLGKHVNKIAELIVEEGTERLAVMNKFEGRRVL